MKDKTNNKFSLGDLVAALFDEARSVTTDRAEQTVLVYAALRDLLQGKARTAHPVRVGVRMTSGH